MPWCDANLNWKCTKAWRSLSPLPRFSNEQKTPEGISIDLEKKNLVLLPLQSKNGLAERDMDSLTIATDSDAKEGVYTLALVLYFDRSDGWTVQSTEYFTVSVQE